MDKEEFIEILKRQQSSRLNVKAFCANESYSESSFHYWKGKFGLTRPHKNYPPEMPSPVFAPVSFESPKSAATNVSSDNSIVIDYPNGIRIRFSGERQLESAMNLITQIYSGHVLSE